MESEKGADFLVCFYRTDAPEMDARSHWLVTSRDP